MDLQNDRTALIVAHPGHEGLLYGWMETLRPLVFILSDGSGRLGESRIRYSRRLIDRAGARAGAVFGAAPDARWYQAMLDGDIAFFMNWQKQIEDAVADDTVSQLLCDPVELYNPLHDLGNAMCHGVARLLEHRGGTSLPVWTFPIMTAPKWFGSRYQEIRMTEAMLARKQRATADYVPLAAEATELAETLGSGFERLYPEGAGYAWAQTPERKPFYEEYGETRIREAQYKTLITYRDHVRPIALRLLGHSQDEL
jgi:hypothetical protein